jgi:hypothetical protein
VADSIRRRIQRLRRPYIWVCILTGLTLVSWLFIPSFFHWKWSMYLLAAVTIVYFVSFIRLCNHIKCPRCKKNLPLMPTRPIPTYSVMNFCPCCGVDLDSQNSDAVV